MVRSGNHYLGVDFEGAKLIHNFDENSPIFGSRIFEITPQSVQTQAKNPETQNVCYIWSILSIEIISRLFRCDF